MLPIIEWDCLSQNEQQQRLQRPAIKTTDLNAQVLPIITTVQQRGDQALREFTAKYDGAVLTDLRVSDQEIAAAFAGIDPNLLVAIKIAAERIQHYQSTCLPDAITIDTYDGIVCQRIPRAIERVGLYVPGGITPLISTLMMLAIPARIAGCRQRVICTPPQADGKVNPALLVAASLCDVHAIYKVGGAQAIAAMAYGTETVPMVDKIFGPGNSWVTAAKQLVARTPGLASIDLPAGPSEVLVIADDSADPAFVAADLLSQAEHGTDSQVLLVTPSRQLAQAVAQAITTQQATLSRNAIMQQSLAHGAIILVSNLNTAYQISNQYAPEHLILQLPDNKINLDQIQNAGAVFVGALTPETMGDYLNGSNHVLPTYGYARSISGLSVTDFMKYISVQRVSSGGLQRYGQAAMTLARTEGLTAHEAAVAVRLRKFNFE